MLENRDWLRGTLIVLFVACLLNTIYTCIVKLQERQIGSTEVAKDAPTMLMPSITFCPAAMRDFSDNKATNITEDYASLPKDLDWSPGVSQNVLVDNRFAIQLAAHGRICSTLTVLVSLLRSQRVNLTLSNYKDFFAISVGPTEQNDGIKACLTYNPPGTYMPGFQLDLGVSL